MLGRRKGVGMEADSRRLDPFIEKLEEAVTKHLTL